MSNINKFLSKFDKEFARPCNFEVDIIIPPALLSLGMTNEILSFRCEATELPSRTFALTQQKTYGPIAYFPVQSAYDKVNLSFLCADDMKEKEFFDAWLNYISPNKKSVVEASLGNNPFIGAPGVLFDFEYSDNYVTTVHVKQKTLDYRDSYIVTLLRAYPISVNSMPLAWETTNITHKLNVTFAFRYYTERKIY